MPVKIVPVSEARRNLKAVLDDLDRTGQPCFLTQHGRPKAVLVSFEEYGRLTERPGAAHPRIVRRSGISGSEPIIEGTRITVRHIVERVASGQSEAEILTALPHLTAAQIHDALSYYHDHLEEIERLIEEAQPERVLSLHGLRPHQVDREIFELRPSP